MVKQSLQILWQTIIRIFAFVSKEIRAILHQPSLIFSLILGPFLILLIFGVGYRDSPRTLYTLFVVPENSEIADRVEEIATSLGSRISFAGIVHDAAEADQMLRAREVDLVVVTPLDPVADWQNGEQSTFTLYHSEVDPFENVYIQVIGQRYIEEINQQLLMAALASSQNEASVWQEDVGEAKTQASTVREAFAAGNTALANRSAEALKEDLNLLTMAVSSGVALVASLEEAGSHSNTTTQLRAELETLQSQVDDLLAFTEDNTLLSEGEATAAEIEASLAEVDSLLLTFQEMDTNVLVAPFRSESLSITQARIEPMHFYVPGVIALLLQHLAITLAGLSIIREKMGGTMELFRAAPVTAFETLFGKYIGYFLIIGVLAAVLTSLVVLILRVPMLGSWGHYVAVILALMLASMSIGFHISLSAGSHSQAIQYGMLTLLAAIFFSGFFLPLYRLAPMVSIVSWLLPATYGTVLLQDVMLRGEAPQILLLIALYGFAIVLLLLAWFRLGRQMAKE